MGKIICSGVLCLSLALLAFHYSNTLCGLGAIIAFFTTLDSMEGL